MGPQRTADYFSRMVNYDDWILSPALFNWLNSLLDPHTVDRFANSTNTWLPQCNSRFWVPRSEAMVPGSEAIDLFTCSWANDNNWWCSLIYLIPGVIRHAQSNKVKGTLIIPQWPSAPFRPLLFPNTF